MSDGLKWGGMLTVLKWYSTKKCSCLEWRATVCAVETTLMLLAALASAYWRPYSALPQFCCDLELLHSPRLNYDFGNKFPKAICFVFFSFKVNTLQIGSVSCVRIKLSCYSQSYASVVAAIKQKKLLLTLSAFPRILCRYWKFSLWPKGQKYLYLCSRLHDKSWKQGNIIRRHFSLLPVMCC